MNDIKRVMIDLETLSTEKNAAVVAIGAVLFNNTEILKTFETYIDIKKVKGHQSTETHLFWSKQPREVRDKVMGGTKDPVQALIEFDGFFSLSGATEVWANAPTFDCDILRNFYRSEGYKDAPWHFRNERCFRTITSLAKHLEIDYRSAYEGIIPHDPLSDATHQAKALQLILRTI